MGGVCRLWSQHIGVNEPLRSQTCQAKFANRRCVCEPSNRVCEPPTRSLRTMTGVCEPNQVSRTSHEPKAGGTNFREWIYTILATIETPSVWPWNWPTLSLVCRALTVWQSVSLWVLTRRPSDTVTKLAVAAVAVAVAVAVIEIKSLSFGQSSAWQISPSCATSEISKLFVSKAVKSNSHFHDLAHSWVPWSLFVSNLKKVSCCNKWFVRTCNGNPVVSPIFTVGFIGNIAFTLCMFILWSVLINGSESNRKVWQDFIWSATASAQDLRLLDWLEPKALEVRKHRVLHFLVLITAMALQTYRMPLLIPKTDRSKKIVEMTSHPWQTSGDQLQSLEFCDLCELWNLNGVNGVNGMCHVQLSARLSFGKTNDAKAGPRKKLSIYSALPKPSCANRAMSCGQKVSSMTALSLVLLSQPCESPQIDKSTGMKNRKQPTQSLCFWRPIA